MQLASDVRNVLLIAAVGGSPAPFAAAVLANRPLRVAFVCSPNSARSIDQQETVPANNDAGVLQRGQRAGYELDPGRYQIVLVDDPQDLEACVRPIHQRLTPVVEAWAARGPSFEVVVDFTGGTKCMSVALGLMARAWPCRLEYVGGTERTKGDVGVVVDGKEQVVGPRDPWRALGYQVAEEAVTLFDRGDAAAASALLAQSLQGSAGPFKRALATFRQLVDGYTCWDRFDHAAALRWIDLAIENHNQLQELFGAGRGESWIKRIRADRVVPLKLAGSAGPSMELVADLVANARRRVQEHRYEDAVARLYRAVEALGQWQLASAHSLASTAAIPLVAVPPTLRKAWAAETAPDGTVRLALLNAYRLLEAFDDELGGCFRRLGFLAEAAGPGASLLAARNHSILAHGFAPIDCGAAEHMYQIVIELACIQEQALTQFPQLRSSNA
jgi:CRISPR-associated protein (TIGR02710 family)